MGMTIMQMAVLPTVNVSAEDWYDTSAWTEAARQEVDFSCFGEVGIFSEEETAKITERIYRALEYRQDTIYLMSREELFNLRLDEYLLKKYGPEGAVSMRGEVSAEDVLTAEELKIYKDEDFPVISNTSEAKDALTKIYSCIIYKWEVGALAARQLKTCAETDRVTCCSPFYYVTEEEYEEEFSGMMRLVDEALSGVQPSWSDVEKALYLHDWIAFKFDYDTRKNDYNDTIIEVASAEGTTTEIEKPLEGNIKSNVEQSPYGLYKNGEAVCEGYARMYNILLGRVGIQSEIVISNELEHGWNVVKIDDLWYHVDITKDDPIGGAPGTVKHNFFLNGHYWNMGASTGEDANDAIDLYLVNGKHLCEIQARSKDRYAKEAAFWEKSEKRILPYGENEWLVVECDLAGGNYATVNFNVYHFDQDAAVATCRTLLTEDIIWRENGLPIKYQYTNAITYAGDYLIYYTPTALKAFVEDKGVKVIFDMNQDEAAEHGEYVDMYLDGDIVHLATSREVRANGEREYNVLNMRSLKFLLDAIFILDAQLEWQPWENWMRGILPSFVDKETPKKSSGDLDGNGKIDVVEVANVQQVLLGQREIEETHKEAIDMDGDGMIDGFDLAIMKRMILNQNR